jgi:hypothetical protein
LFGAEFKSAEINGRDAHLFGGLCGPSSTAAVSAAGRYEIDGCHVRRLYYGYSGCGYDDYYGDYHPP